MFLPFLAALSALFGGVEKTAGKPPESNKTIRISGHKKKEKTGEKRRSMDKQDKGLASNLIRQAETSHGNAVRRGFGFGIKRQFGDSFLSTKKQVF